MNLDARIIVRDEGDGVLLYNGDNGALILLQQYIYQRILSEDSEEHNGSRDLHDWLYQSGFLEEKPPSSGLSEKRSASQAEADQKAFFSLRSDRNPLNVLWALIPRCNLNCVYCFPEARFHSIRKASLGPQELHAIADQIVRSQALKVTLSGGECLLLRELWGIVENLREAGISVAIISNGTTISPTVIEKLSLHGVQVGISLDAPDEATNAITRGQGVFSRTVRGLQALLSHGIPTSTLVTLTRHNFPVLERHIAFLESLGVRIVTLQDLRPFGTKLLYDQTRLTPQQEEALPGTVQRLKEHHPEVAFNQTELLSFCKDSTNGLIMQCPAGENFAYIDFYGDLYPCTSLTTFKMGNLLGPDSLTDLWRYSPAVAEIRALKRRPLVTIPACRLCPNKVRCDGGCRGDALYYDNDILGLPSRCPKRLGILA